MTRCVSQKGFTILELMAVMTIIMLMSVAGMVTIRGVRRADISTAASKLSAAVRYTYDTAVLNNGTYRLVFDIESGAWWAERVDTSETCGGTAILPGEDEEEDDDKADDGGGTVRNGNPFDGGSMASRMWDLSAIASGAQGGPGGAPGGGLSAAVAEGLQGVQTNQPVATESEAEKAKELRRERSRVRDDLLRKNALPKGISFKSVMTAHNDEPTEEGQAEIYFFPSGYVEKAYIYLQRDEDIYTVETVPLRGTGVVHKEELDARDLVRGG